MKQDELWHEDIDDALDTVIKATGGYKKIAGWLWPSSNSKSAYARLKACVNPDKAERLSPEELMRLLKAGREIGCHAAMNFIAGQTGYEAKPIDPKLYLAELQESFIEYARRMEKISEQITRVQVRSAG